MGEILEILKKFLEESGYTVNAEDKEIQWGCRFDGITSIRTRLNITKDRFTPLFVHITAGELVSQATKITMECVCGVATTINLHHPDSFKHISEWINDHVTQRPHWIEIK